MKIIILLFIISVSFTQKILSQGFEEELTGCNWTVSLTQFEDQTYFLKLDNESPKLSQSKLYTLNESGIITHSKIEETARNKTEQNYFVEYTKPVTQFISKHPTEYQIIDKESKIIYNFKHQSLTIFDEELNEKSFYFEIPKSINKNIHFSIFKKQCCKGLDENKNPYWIFNSISEIIAIKFDVKTQKFNYVFTTLKKNITNAPIGYLKGKFMFCQYDKNFSDSCKVEICSINNENIVKVENKFSVKIPKINRVLDTHNFFKCTSHENLINNDNLYFTVKILNQSDDYDKNYKFIFYKFDGETVQSVVYENVTKNDVPHFRFDVIESNSDEVRFMIKGENGVAIIWDVDFNLEEVQDRSVFIDIATNKDCVGANDNYRKDDAIYNLYLFEKLLDPETLSEIKSNNTVPFVFLDYKGNAETINATIDCNKEKTTLTFDPTVK